MIYFFGKRKANENGAASIKDKLFNLHNLDFDRLALYILPRFLLEVIRKYLRLEVEGTEHLPSKGSVIVAPNHSGWSGFDAVMVGHEIFKQKKRIPRMLAHKAWFLGEIGTVSHKMGLLEATTQNGLRLLKKGNVVVLFPEGEYGNFKPSAERYQLKEFKRGFIRMSLRTGAPIVPTIVIGAEETHINLANLKFTKYLKGQLIPIPLNVLPLPAKWKIKFLEPISFSQYTPDDADNVELVHELAESVRALMQQAIDYEVSQRKWVYFGASGGATEEAPSKEEQSSTFVE